MGTRAFGLGSCSLQLRLALPDIRDVGGGSDQPIRTAIRPAQRDAVLSYPVPGTVVAEITVLVLQALGLAAEMCRQRRAQIRQILGMNERGPVRAASRQLGGQPLDVM